jgi:hypothetical protein
LAAAIGLPLITFVAAAFVALALLTAMLTKPRQALTTAE